MNEAIAELKISCNKCGQHIKCDESYRGTQISCPQCSQILVIPVLEERERNPQSALTKFRSKEVQGVMLFVVCVVMLGCWAFFQKDDIAAWFHNLKPAPTESAQQMPKAGNPQPPTQATATTPPANQQRYYFQKIVVRLDKVLDEPMNFDGNDERRKREQERLDSFANSEKAEIGDIINELANAGATKAETDNAKAIVESFFETYKYRITVCKASYFEIERGDMGESSKMHVASLQAYNKMLEIRQAFNYAK